MYGVKYPNAAIPNEIISKSIVLSFSSSFIDLSCGGLCNWPFLARGIDQNKKQQGVSTTAMIIAMIRIDHRHPYLHLLVECLVSGILEDSGV